MRTVAFFLVVLFIQPAHSEIPERSAVLKTLVESELAFARTCGEVGIRASFMKFFADDGIAFKPEPFRYNETVRNLPPPANPKGFLLEWEPQVADVASSGDMGYTTGPSVRTDKTAKDQRQSYGQFFSVWKKQKDGTWKVALDIGTDTPAPAAPLGVPFKDRGISLVPSPNKKSPEAQLAEVMNLDQMLSESSASLGVVKAYLPLLDDESRLHRESEMPIVGRGAIQSYLNKQSTLPTWTPIAGDVSVAGDLGYTYGSCEFKSGEKIAEKGYYVHVWKRHGGGWKLVADILNPLPPGKKE